MSRRTLSGLALLVAFAAVWCLAHFYPVLHIALAVPTLIGLTLYVIGNSAPVKIRRWVEAHLRSSLAYLGFYLPNFLLPMVQFSTKVLFWLGLDV